MSLAPRTFLASLLAALTLAACGANAGQATGPVVLAPSSMSEVMEELADSWAAQGHQRPVLSLAGTQALARQVEAGAPADVIISADAEWMDWLAQRQLIRPETRKNVAGNRLVLIKPRGAGTITLNSLGAGRLAMADPQAVPAGRYARTSLEALELWDDLAAQVVPTENVRAALALVERGEAELGIVYITDALASDRVEPVEYLPVGSYPIIRYPAAVVALSTNPESEGFVAFLLSQQAQQILADHGFEAP